MKLKEFLKEFHRASREEKEWVIEVKNKGSYNLGDCLKNIKIKAEEMRKIQTEQQQYVDIGYRIIREFRAFYKATNPFTRR